MTTSLSGDTVSIDVKVRTEPSSAYDLSTSLTTQAETVESAHSDVQSAGSTVGTELYGQTASTAYQSLTNQGSRINTLAADMRALGTALDTFADTMASVKKRLLSARDEAVAAGLEVSGDTIRKPSSSSGDTLEDDGGKGRKFNELATTVREIRQEEGEAHDTLQSECENISVPPGVQAGSFYKDAITAANRASQAISVNIAAVWQTRGNFELPSGTPGKPTFKGLNLKNAWSQWKDAKAYKDALKSAKNWTPRPEFENSFSWKAASGASKLVDKAAPVLKAAGHVSTALTALLSGRDQYEKDSANHPSMGEGEKVARAGVKGAASAAGGWAGAKVGTEVGAVAGACIGGPVGAVIGGAVGGVVGGVVGSKAGEAAGDWLADKTSQAKDFFGKLF